jgi:hypothetical protein
MRKFVFTLSVLLLLSLTPLVGAAQPPDWGQWEALAYDANAGTLYSIDSTQAGTQRQLPAPAGYQEIIPRQISVSSDGTLLAYMTYEQALGNGVSPAALPPRNGTMMVYNRTTGQADPYPFNGILAHSLDFLGNPFMFDPSGQRLAVGYLQPDGWYIAVLDVVNRTYTDALLIERDVTLTGAAATYENALPLITNFDGTFVEFIVFPADALEPPLVLNSYRWDITQPEPNAAQTVRFPDANYDVFELTGEVVFAATSEAFPQNQNAFPRLHQNVLDVALPDGGRIPFYTSSQFSLFAPRFGQFGQKVVFGARDANGGVTYTAIPRSGGPGQVISSPLADLGIQEMRGTEYGVIVTADSTLAAEVLGVQQLSGTSIVHVDLRPNAPQPLQPVTSIEAPFLRLVWVGFTPVDPNVNYGAWVDVSAGGAVTEQGGGNAAVSVGATATVFTTEGDPLNIRSGPGTQFSIVDRVLSGETVSVLEGPVTAENFTWWRVRTPAGIEGWTVESADNVRTLQITGSAPVAVATPLPAGIFVGGQATVALNPGGAANLRAEPSTSAPVSRIIRDNRTFNVIGGPVSADGYVWWQVQTPDTSLTGWMVEAVGDETVLEPGSGG